MILGFVLGVALLVWSIWPLFQEQGLMFVPAGEASQRRTEAEQARQAQLQELEDDFALGRVGESDYQRSKSAFESKGEPGEVISSQTEEEGRVFCIHCGQANPKTARFCMACGRKIDYA